MAAKKKTSFEARMESLEAMVRTLESGEVPLEDALKLYEEGTALAASLEEDLASAQQRLTVLRKNAEGGFSEMPLEDGHEDA